MGACADDRLVSTVDSQVAFWKDIEPRSSPDGSHGAARLFPDPSTSKHTWPALLAGASARHFAVLTVIRRSSSIPRPAVMGGASARCTQARCARSGPTPRTNPRASRAASRSGGCGRTSTRTRTQRTGAASRL